MSKKPAPSPWRLELDLEIAKRARITASLREQRLKRDAELPTVSPPVKPVKRARKKKSDAEL
jgi:hypothetical protein